ncbi:MAG TPA: flagellar basal body-associated FliL family protein [Macromonas sp.]|nr:flagellar basal body-associated FliL family protein [Macromonas sp.]
MLIIIGAVVALALIVGGALFFVLKKNADDSEGEAGAETSASEEHQEAKVPPQFLPIDPLVVNLADPEEPRFAQVGITLQVADAHTADQIKVFMPAVRNGILLKLSARTSAEVLTADGKTKLADEVLALVRKETGLNSKKDNPVQAVLFSSIIVQ